MLLALTLQTGWGPEIPMNEIPAPDVLLDVSNRFLQDLMVASLERSARQLKTAKIAWAEAVQEQAVAIAAQYFLDNREALLESARRTVVMQSVLEFPNAKAS